MNFMNVFSTGILFLCAGSICLVADEEASSDLFTRVYPVSPTFLSTRDGSDKEVSSDPFAEKKGRKKRQTAQERFESLGVVFRTGAAVIAGGATSSLVVRNTEAELAKVEAIIERQHELMAPKVINVIVEFIEVEEGVYHDWMFENRLNKAGAVLRRQVQVWVKSGDARIAETMCVATRSGQRAKTQSVSEVIYPTEPGVPGIPNVVLLEGRRSSAPIEAAVPSAYETRYIGATMEVDAVLGIDNTTVDLSLSPESVKSLGLIDWPPHSEDHFFTISMPRFYAVKVATQVALLSQSYTLLGVGRASGSDEQKGGSPMVLMFVRADVSRVSSFKKLQSKPHEK